MELSRRLERAEGHVCAMFAEAQGRVRPESGAEWMEYAGVYSAFNGVTSLVTQTFGLGIFETANAAMLDVIERFFFERGAATVHEVSPFAGVAAMELLCNRGYRPVEISNVMYRPVEAPAPANLPDVRAHVAGLAETSVWADVLARAWSSEHPELAELLAGHGAIAAACKDSVPFLAEYRGQPGAAGSLCLHEGVGLLGGAATVPELRRRGLQTALIAARMQYAMDHGCDLLMVAVEPGSNSQRNAERNGFRVAYTRTKWRLDKPKPV